MLNLFLFRVGDLHYCMGMHFSFHFVSIEWIKESTGARDLAWTIGL